MVISTAEVNEIPSIIEYFPQSKCPLVAWKYILEPNCLITSPSRFDYQIEFTWIIWKTKIYFTHCTFIFNTTRLHVIRVCEMYSMDTSCRLRLLIILFKMIKGYNCSENLSVNLIWLAVSENECNFHLDILLFSVPAIRYYAGKND